MDYQPLAFYKNMARVSSALKKNITEHEDYNFIVH